MPGLRYYRRCPALARSPMTALKRDWHSDFHLEWRISALICAGSLLRTRALYPALSAASALLESSAAGARAGNAQGPRSPGSRFAPFAQMTAPAAHHSRSKPPRVSMTPYYRQSPERMSSGLEACTAFAEGG